MPEPIRRSDLMGLEQYAEAREAFRARVMEHKKKRRVAVGNHVTLLFEDRLTIHYQLQEILRVERVFEPEAIDEELQAYNPLIPDGRNLKATMLIEYDDPATRREELSKLVGIEDAVWMQAAGHERSAAIADEDLERSEADKTSAVHFLRFEFSEAAVADLRGGAALAAGVDHPCYSHQTDSLPDSVRASLLKDFQG
ncbi:MAG: DUF3501 family protein [Gammaproteobacteria bacterium]|nr:DUF3501 family protein [Gammaproteobacteria bacterium]